MGFFSTKRKVYVSSTVYKVIDDGNDRATFMQEVIASAALRDSPSSSYADAIVDGINKGPRANQRSFFRWCKRYFDDGMPRAAINYTNVIDYDVVAAEILATKFAGSQNHTVSVIDAFIDNADESHYAERWVYENRPELAGLEWAADVDPDTNEIWIQYPAGTTYQGSPKTTDSFSQPGFNTSNNILVAYYTYETAGVASNTQVFIYEIGDGNEDLDANYVQLDDGSETREFYPFIPLRIDNVSVFDSGSPARQQEELITKAWDKALGTDIQTTIDEINDNESIDDIDYAYLVFGVSLNTKDIAELDYIFNFFRLLAGSQGVPAGSHQQFRDENDAEGYHPQSQGYTSAVNTSAYNAGNGYIGGVSTATSGTAPLVSDIHLTLPSNQFGVLDMKITWSEITETRKTGLIHNGAKKNDVTLELGNVYKHTVSLPTIGKVEDKENSVSGIIIKKQVTDLEYVEIVVDGLLHKNLIYEGKSVDISAADAMEDDEESGFIIPLHEPTLKAMGSVRASDVARESYLLVFNSYQVVKRKFFQRGIFKVLLAVIIITVVVVSIIATGGASSPLLSAVPSILGTAAGIGGALGFTGALAIAVGTVANAIAALIVLKLVTLGATKIFGEKFGQIIAIVATVVLTLATGPGGLNFSNISSNLANLSSIDKLIALTGATSDVVSIIQQDKLQDILEKTELQTEDYEEEVDRIKDLWEELGFGDNIIDPRMLTDFTDPTNLSSRFGNDFVLPSTFGELPDQFLDRTLLVGSELIDISQSMVSDFVDATLTLR